MAVQLVNNSNRTYNPFKGRFLQTLITKMGVVKTKGESETSPNPRLDKKAQWVFKNYEDLISLEDHLLDYVNDVVANYKTDRVANLKWDFVEELTEAFKHFNSVLKTDAQKEVLRAIWQKLQLVANKLDVAIEKALNENFQYFVTEMAKLSNVENKQNVEYGSYEEGLENIIPKFYSGLIRDIKAETKKQYTRDCMFFLTKWIELICQSKKIEYTLTEKTSPNGLKYSIFELSKKEKEKIENKVSEVLDVELTRKKIIEYERFLLKKEISEKGCATIESKTIQGDQVDIYYIENPKKTTKDELIKSAQKEIFKSSENDFEKQIRLKYGIRITDKIKSLIFDLATSKNEKQDLKKLESLIKSESLGILKSVFQTSPISSKLVEILSESLRNGGTETLNFDTSFYAIYTSNVYPELNEWVDKLPFPLKDLMPYIRATKYKTDAEFHLKLQNVLAKNFSQYQNSFEDILQGISSIPFIKEYNLFKENVDDVFFDIEKNKTDAELVNSLKKLKKNLSVKIGSEIESPLHIVNIEKKIKELQKEEEDKVQTIYSEALGVVEAEGNLSAMEVYKAKKIEASIIAKGLKQAIPSIVGNQLIFKEMEREPEYEIDPATGDFLLQNGKKVIKYQVDEKGKVLVDKKTGLPLLKYKENVISQTAIEKLTEDQMLGLIGKERQVELSDDMRVKKELRPYQNVLLVRVKKFVTAEGLVKDVVTQGKYRGFCVQDLANAMGKFIGDGSVYTTDNVGNITHKYEMVNVIDGGVSINHPALEEPYMTWANGKFLIGIPNSDGWTAERQALSSLQKGRSGSMILEGGKLRKSFYFSGEDYESVKKCCGSILMSKKAQEELQKYYALVMQKELALKAENLERYKPEEIGGFKPTIGGVPFMFNNKQLDSLAWLGVNGLKGVMALDTGIGKTLVGIGAMQLAIKENPEAKFLVVSPARLVGNFGGDVNTFLTENARDNLLGNKKLKVDGKMEEVSYKKFVDMVEKGIDFENEYECIIFDEVNEALRGEKAKAIAKLKHPRKILLTASALEKSPMDLYRFVQLAEGVETSPEKEKAFGETYLIQVGGRYVGVKPEMQHLFNMWVKQNAYFAYKTEVNYKDVGRPELKPLYQESKKIVMDDSITDAYSKVANDLKKELALMQEKYLSLQKGFETDTERKKFERKFENFKDFAVGGFSAKVKLLHLFSINPNKAMTQFNKLYLNKEEKVTGLPNPKVEEASLLAVKYTTASKPKRVIYFTEDSEVAKETIAQISNKVRGKLHALCLTSTIQFYLNGKPLLNAKINKNTDLEKFNVESFIPKTSATKKKTTTQVPVEEQMSWAIDAVKKSIKDNPTVVTMVCNDSYARGFNLQSFGAVVHLDRDGWDSEEIKQRTARAFRQGQKDAVEEIILDAVMPSNGSISIDDLRGLVHETDQKFFNSIIADSKKINLVEDFQSVERTTVTKEMTAPTLEQFARAILPTPEVLSEIDRIENERKIDPVLSLTLPAHRFEHPSVKTFLKNAEVDFPDYSQDQLKKMLDITGVSSAMALTPDILPQDVVLLTEYTNLGLGMGSFKNYITTLHRDIHYDDMGDIKKIHSSTFYTETCSPPSIGAKVLIGQIASNVNYGTPKIDTYAVGDFKSFNLETGIAKENANIGYYVWAKFGYDANINITNFKVDHITLKGSAMAYEECLNRANQNITNQITEPIKPLRKKPSIKVVKPSKEQLLIGICKKFVEILNQVGLDISSLGMGGSDYTAQAETFARFGIIKQRNFDLEMQTLANNKLAIGNNGFSNYKVIDLLPMELNNFYIPRDADYYTDSYDKSSILTLNGFKVSPIKNKILNDITLWNLFVDIAKKTLPLDVEYFNSVRLNKPLSGNLESFERTYFEQKNQEYATFEQEQNKLNSQYEQELVLYQEQLNQYNQQKKDLELSGAIQQLSVDQESVQQMIDDGIITENTLKMMTLDSSTHWYLFKYLKCAYYVEKQKASISTLLDLYSITFTDESGVVVRAGEEWWKLVGSNIDLVLNLDLNSKSYKVFKNYTKKKLQQTGCNSIEEFLAQPLEPFNVDSSDCWKLFFEEKLEFFTDLAHRTKLEEYAKIVKNYPKELKASIQDILVEDPMFADVLENWENTYRIKLPIQRTIIEKRLKYASVEQPNVSKQLDTFAYLAQKDSNLFSTALDEVMLEEKTKKMQQEIDELKGDLKFVSNPFTRKGK